MVSGRMLSVRFYREKMMSTLLRSVALILLTIVTLALSSCSGTIVTAMIEPALENMQEQSDIELVCEGTPAYLLMIDSLIAGDQENIDLLTLGTKAYSGYIGAMGECELEAHRIAAMADKAYLYSQMLLQAILDVTPNEDIGSFELHLGSAGKRDAEPLFWSTFGWIIWIQQQQGSPSAMAGLGKIEKLLLKIIELDETVQSGSAHFLLGGYYGSRPAMFGGNPEKSRFHFDRALELSKRKILIFQTVYAETYCRAMLDKNCHDMLLNEVISFPLEANQRNILANTIAKKRAVRLLDEGFF